METILKKIQTDFFKEAMSSPLLLSDLASMETYISESYHDRSLIELLQNADDAKSKRFLILQEGDKVIVANDGRSFTEQDFLSICRSGSSTKSRGQNNIGYRGIGFKSVVNFSERVHIISEDLSVTFSRELTRDLLQKDLEVPLIRIPHSYMPIYGNNEVIEELIEDNYKVIFIFEGIKQEQLESEAEKFDSSSLLFLRYIKQVEFNTNLSKLITVKRKREGHDEFITISEEGSKESWLVSRPRNIPESAEAIAFLLNEENNLVPLPDEKAVVHSFMPTKDKVGIPIKINGDFSTDPSRTKVVHDELSESYIDKCTRLLINITNDYLAGNNNYAGCFELFRNLKSDTLNMFKLSKEFNEIFIDSFKKNLTDRELLFDGKTQHLLTSLRFTPQWLNDEDFIIISNTLRLEPLTKSYESKFPGIRQFGEGIGVNALDLMDTLKGTQSVTVSKYGGAQILSEALNKLRFNLSQENIEKLISARFIYIDKGLIPLSEVQGGEVILETEFESYLNQIVHDLDEIKWFLKKLGVDLKLQNISPQNEIISQSDILTTCKEEKPSTSLTSKVSNEKKFSAVTFKWRSAELNLKTFLQEEPNVKEVIDVSKSNLGYDIEVRKNDGIDYIEIKSVQQLGAGFALTNNEYSTAHELGEQYVLAVVKQDEEKMEVCFVRNPIERLNLNKRVTRWEWACDQYSGEVTIFNF